MSQAVAVSKGVGRQAQRIESVSDYAKADLAALIDTIARMTVAEKAENYRQSNTISQSKEVQHAKRYENTYG